MSVRILLPQGVVVDGLQVRIGIRRHEKIKTMISVVVMVPP
jgi:hypothetical protein